MNTDLTRWQSQPALSKALFDFLQTAPGKLFLQVLRHEFRAVPLKLKIEPGIDYMQINAFMNRDREAWTQVIDFIEMLAVPREKKERLPDAGWATEPLRREPEKEPAASPAPVAKPASPKKRK